MTKIQRKLSIKTVQSYKGKDQFIDFILKSGQAIRVKLLKGDQTTLLVQNALGHKKTLQDSDIKEIWLDEKFMQA